MNNKIKISIITVNKNNFFGLINTYNSLLSQKNFEEISNFIEFVIIDGKSLDGSIDFINNLSPGCSFKSVVENDSGIFDAMNKGIGIACGRHVIFLNSGDTFYDSDVLVNLINLSDAHPELIIAGKINMHWKDHNFISDLKPWVCHQAVITPLVILRKFRFNSNLKFFGDLDLWMRLLKSGLFKPLRVDMIYSNFEYGGIGNNPKYLFTRLLERNSLDEDFNLHLKRYARFIMCCIFYLIWRLFGISFYYRSLFYISKIR